MTTPVLTPAEVVAPTFTATFTTKINGIRTTTIGDRANVVKQVDWTLIGEESGQKFELPQSTTLADPDGQPFIELANLTETEVAAWVEATEPNLNGIKAHIQFVLDKEVAKTALAATPMPWAPVIETPVEPTPPSA